MNLRQRTWDLLDTAKPDDTAGRAFVRAMLALILLNVVAVIAGTVQSVHVRFGGVLAVFEVVSVAIFTLEYVARLWSCTVDPRFRGGGVSGRIRCALKGMSIVDLLAILPFYLPFLGVDLRSLRVLRLLRVLRIAKVGRYYSSLNLIGQVVQAKRDELTLTSALMALLLVVSSTLLYYCENAVQPAVFSSIPATMWWAVTTLTTVGYGDMYPVTLLGKLCASIVAILGIGMFALPAGLLGAGFIEAMQKAKPSRSTCPHCGKEIR